MNKINFMLSIDLYKRDVLVSIGETHKDRVTKLQKLLKRTLTKKEVNLCNLTGKGKSVMFDTGASLLMIGGMPSTPYWKGVLAHEIFHIVDFIMEEIGMKLSNTNDEAYAYLIAFITEKIYLKIE